MSSPSNRKTAQNWLSHSCIARRAIMSNTGCVSVGELEITRKTSLVAVCCSSDSVSSAVRSSTFCSRVFCESCSRAVVWLNSSASAWSSSPVRMSMRWSSSPLPTRAAPSCNRRTGATILRASATLASVASSRPSASTTRLRAVAARSGAKVSSTGRSMNTSQPSAGIAACTVSTWPPCSAFGDREHLLILRAGNALRPGRLDLRRVGEVALLQARACRSGWAMSWSFESTTYALPARPVPMRVTTSQIARMLTSAAVTSAAVSSGATAIVMNGSVSFLK